jgi:HAD superfamily hydrolase (TIGR01509 family)
MAAGYPRAVSTNEPARRRPAVLFDVDGTLVDSNYLHTMAWRRAFAEGGVDVETWRIHRAIGMDGSTLVKTLSGDAPGDVQQQLKDSHSRYYNEITGLLHRLPGARQLLEHLATQGFQIVLATSAPQDELAVLREVLASDDLVAEITSSADVDMAKPDPGIVAVALDRAGVPADRAVFVGDAVWDAEACVRIGMASIGLLSGGISRAELTDAGAAVAFDNPEDLLRHLDETPIGALAAELPSDL